MQTPSFALLCIIAVLCWKFLVHKSFSAVIQLLVHMNSLLEFFSAFRILHPINLGYDKQSTVGDFPFELKK